MHPHLIKRNPINREDTKIYINPESLPLPAHLLLELEELAGAAEVPEVAELLPQPLVLRVHRLALQPDLRLRWRILR